MGHLVVERLDYRADTVAWFGHLAGSPWSALLDSAGQPGGRFDIVVSEPRLTLETRGPVTEIRDRYGQACSGEDPFDLIRRLLGPYRVAGPGAGPDLPFVGGALGWFGYDLGRRIERLPATAADPLGLPQLALGIYDWALVVDHGLRQAYLVGQGDSQGLAPLRLRSAYRDRRAPQVRGFSTWGPIETNLDAVAYRRCFARVQSLIHAGDCYQVNLARRYRVQAAGDPWSAYLRLRGLSPAPYSAYLNGPAGAVLSVSPERFLRVRHGAVETCPIKGTAPRGRDPAEDRALGEGLRRSPKDRAENLMIVDLLRNDLGRSCAIGSLRVRGLFELQSFPGVHHLVSTITGRLGPGQDALALLRGAFPGGSITGAPKIRAMEIIEALEGERRGVYCGAIGYLGFDGAMDTSIAIRTALYAREHLWLWAGGGLVADSQVDREWEEIGVKVRAMLTLVRSFRVEGAGAAVRASAAHGPLAPIRRRGSRGVSP